MYMAVWGLWTALLRPLSGEPWWETIERAPNYLVPLALLFVLSCFHYYTAGFGLLPEVTHRGIHLAFVLGLSFLLLSIVYYHGAGMLVDVGASIGQGAAIGISLGTLVGGFALYDGLWRSPLG